MLYIYIQNCFSSIYVLSDIYIKAASSALMTLISSIGLDV